ncbi:LysR substrate-binding domain-containing protein [soil metagenome]
MNSGPSFDHNMRRLRAFVAVAQWRSVNRASEHLHLTQPAVTRAVRSLENELEVSLFDRSPRGMALTDYGRLVYERAKRAFDYLKLAEQELATATPSGDPRKKACGLVGKIARRHMQAIVGIDEYQTETAAALQMNLSQPAVTLALRDLERIVDAQLFVRTARGMIATPYGDVMVRRAKLAMAELAAASDDIAAHVGIVRGRLVVGVLPLSGTLLAPTAITLVNREHPHLRLSMLEGPYDSLLKGLRCGDVDVIVGALHHSPAPDVTQERLFDDQLSVVVRKGHPLTRRKSMSLADVADAEWVVPFKRTTWRNTLEKAMLSSGLDIPDSAIETNTLTTVRALLLESDRLSVLSRRQIQYDERGGLLAVLPIDMSGTELPIGVATRADAKHSAGLGALLAHLRTLLSEPASSNGAKRAKG